MQCAALIMVKLVSMLIKFIFQVKKKLLHCIFTKSITDLFVMLSFFSLFNNCCQIQFNRQLYIYISSLLFLSTLVTSLMYIYIHDLSLQLHISFFSFSSSAKKNSIPSLPLYFFLFFTSWLNTSILVENL